MKKMIPTILFLFCFTSRLEAAKKMAPFFPDSFKAVFKQSYRSALSGQLKSSRGEIDYKYPGHIRFETHKPENIVFVSNKFKTWYYTAPFLKGEKGELSIQGASKNVLTRFFDVLHHGLKSNDLYKVIKTKKGHKFIFTKKAKKSIGIEDALLTFKSSPPHFSSLRSLVLTYPDRNKIKLTLSKIEKNYNFKKGYFFFKTPKNTKIIRR